MAMPLRHVFLGYSVASFGITIIGVVSLVSRGVTTKKKYISLVEVA